MHAACGAAAAGGAECAKSPHRPRAYRRFVPIAPRSAGPARPQQPPAMDLHGYQALTWTLASLTIAAFTIYAMSITYLRRQRLRGSLKFNQEEFITARSQVRCSERNTAQARSRQLPALCRGP